MFTTFFMDSLRAVTRNQQAQLLSWLELNDNENDVVPINGQ